MSLDSMLGFVISRVVPLAVIGLGGCVVPETVGDGPPMVDGGDGSGGSGRGSDGETDPMETTVDPEQTDGETASDTGSAIECFGLPDEQTCLDAGCNYFETVLQVSDACECTPGVPACLFFVGEEIGGAASPDFFWHEASGTVAMFSTSWLEPPVGWRSCTEAGAPPACACYEPFMAPECP
jgi:hypothetical protein